MSSTIQKKTKEYLEIRSADVEDQSSSSGDPPTGIKFSSQHRHHSSHHRTSSNNNHHNNNNTHLSPGDSNQQILNALSSAKRGGTNKKRSRGEALTLVTAESSDLTNTLASEVLGVGSGEVGGEGGGLENENEKLYRVRWTEDMEKHLTECVQPHIRITPGKGLKQVDWNAVLEEMNSEFPHFDFTRKSLKNKYQRLGGLSLDQSNLQTDVGNYPTTSADELDEPEFDEVKAKLPARKIAKGTTPATTITTVSNSSAASTISIVSAILAEDREALLSEKAIDEFTNQAIYSKIREDPNKALLVIEKLMIYENAKKFFLVKPESLRVLFVEKWTTNHK